jgi:hypothetical protein
VAEFGHDDSELFFKLLCHQSPMAPHNSTPWSKVNLCSKPEKGRPFARWPFVFPGIFPNAIRK